MSEEVKSRYHLRRREFLNEDPARPAFIIGIVEDTREFPNDDPEQDWNHGEIALDLADCERRISFYFRMVDPETRANSLRKITLIAEVVNAFRDALVLEIESRNARPARKSELPEVKVQKFNWTAPLRALRDAVSQGFSALNRN